MLKVVTVAAFVLFALLSAFATLLMAAILSEFATDPEVVLWPSFLIYAAVVAATVALGLAARRMTAPVKPETLFERLKALREGDNEVGAFFGKFPADEEQIKAITRLLERDRRATAQLGLGPDNGFGAIAGIAEAATARGDPEAHQCWRDVAQLMAGFDDRGAVAALKGANALKSTDLWILFELQRRLIVLCEWDEASRVGKIGGEVAKSDHERVVMFINDASICMMTFDARGMAQLAEQLTAIARSGPPDLLDLIEMHVANTVDVGAQLLKRDADFVAARWLWTAYVDLRRVLAERRPTKEAKSALAKALIGAGEYLVERANSNEGKALLAEGRALAG